LLRRSNYLYEAMLKKNGDFGKDPQADPAASTNAEFLAKESIINLQVGCCVVDALLQLHIWFSNPTHVPSRTLSAALAWTDRPTD
jgi:hypothetical protein